LVFNYYTTITPKHLVYDVPFVEGFGMYV